MAASEDREASNLVDSDTAAVAPLAMVVAEAADTPAVEVDDLNMREAVEVRS